MKWWPWERKKKAPQGSSISSPVEALRLTYPPPLLGVAVLTVPGAEKIIDAGGTLPEAAARRFLEDVKRVALFRIKYRSKQQEVGRASATVCCHDIAIDVGILPEKERLGS